MICCARCKRARLVSHSRLVGLGVRLKPGRSWFDSRGWDEWNAGRSHALPTALPQHRWRKPPPSRRVEVTGQCATLTAAGSTPVACSARAIWRARHARGSHAPPPRYASPDARHTDARHPTRANARSARAEGKAHAARCVHHPDRCCVIPGLRAQERSGPLPPPRGRRAPTHQRVRSTGSFPRRSW